MTTTMATNGKHNYQAKFNDRALGLGSKLGYSLQPTMHLPPHHAPPNIRARYIIGGSLT